MKKQTYGFSTRYQDVNFSRIVEENSDSDFIRVEWKDECGNDQVIVFVTPSGKKRCEAAGMSYGLIQKTVSVRPYGSLDIFYGRCDDNLCVLYINNERCADNDIFEKWYGRLREREERRRPIKVTAIV
jgi:ribosomal protein S27E